MEKFADMAKHDHEMSANRIGFQLSTFEFLFDVCLGHMVFQLADSLSNALQEYVKPLQHLLIALLL